MDKDQVAEILVGIGTLPDEVLPDGLYPRRRILLSPDVFRRFSCPLVELPPGASVEQIIDAVLPKGCARSYLYYSLKLRDGAAGVAAAEAAFVQRATELNQALPHEEGAPGYFLIATTTEQQRAQVARWSPFLRRRGRGGHSNCGSPATLCCWR